MIYAFNRVIHILHTNESEARVREFIIVPWFICECYIFKFEYLCFCVRIITSDRLSKAPLLSLFTWSLNSKSNKRKLARGEASRKARRRIKEGNALHWRFSNWRNFECLSGGFLLEILCLEELKSSIDKSAASTKPQRTPGLMVIYCACIIVQLPSRNCFRSSDEGGKVLIRGIRGKTLIYPIWIIFLFDWLRIYMFFSSLFHFGLFSFLRSLSAFCNSNRTVNFYGFIGMKLSFLEWLW